MKKDFFRYLRSVEDRLASDYQNCQAPVQVKSRSSIIIKWLFSLYIIHVCKGSLFYIWGGVRTGLRYTFFQKHGLKWLNIAF